jgi:parvulin-like peptidyl-prolyl isomerase
MPHGSTFGARVPRKAALLFVAFGIAGGVASAGCSPKPVASVNGQNLTEKEFAALCESTRAGRAQTTVGAQVIAEWIKGSILAQEAKRLNVYPAEKDLDARMSAYRTMAAYADNPLDRQLEMMKMTQTAFRQERLNEMVEENVVCNGVAVSDAEIKDFFNRQKANMIRPETVEISQITVTSEANVKKTKDDLASGDFGLVARTRSSDNFASSNGRVPFPIPKKLQPGLPVDQKVVDAAYKLKVGEVTREPVKVADGHWVFVKLEKKQEQREPKFEEWYDIMRAQARLEKTMKTKGNEANQVTPKLLQNANVRIFREPYKSMENEIKQAQQTPGGGPGGEIPPMPPG